MWIHLAAWPFRDAKGDITGVIEFARDVTDSVKAEKALQESREMYLNLFQESNDAIIIHDLEPPGPEVYKWGMLDEFLKFWRKYLHKPGGKVGRYPIPWTGLYCRDPLPLGKLNEVVKKDSQRLWERETKGLEEV